MAGFNGAHLTLTVTDLSVSAAWYRELFGGQPLFEGNDGVSEVTILALPENLLLGLAVIVVGTVLPYGCLVAAVRHVPAARAGVVATLEPVLSALFAFLIHDEGLAAIQIAGGVVVLAAVVWVQTQRPDLAAEAISGEEAAADEPAPAALVTGERRV